MPPSSTTTTLPTILAARLRSREDRYECSEGVPQTWAPAKQVHCCKQNRALCPSPARSHELAEREGTCFNSCGYSTCKETVLVHLGRLEEQAWIPGGGACNVAYQKMMKDCSGTCHKCPIESVCESSQLSHRQLNRTAEPSSAALRGDRAADKQDERHDDRLARMKTAPESTTMTRTTTGTTITRTSTTVTTTSSMTVTTSTRTTTTRTTTVTVTITSTTTKHRVRADTVISKLDPCLPGMACSSSPFMPTIQSDEYDCRLDGKMALAGWSERQQHWCCRHRSVECKFDCRRDEFYWETTWSVEKKEYCCAITGEGCTPFDCNWAGPWAWQKTIWCCRYERKGCSKELLG